VRLTCHHFQNSSEGHSANGHWGLFPRDGPWSVTEPVPRFRKHGDVPPKPQDFDSAPATSTVTNHTPTILLWK